MVVGDDLDMRYDTDLVGLVSAVWHPGRSRGCWCIDRYGSGNGGEIIDSGVIRSVTFIFNYRWWI